MATERKARGERLLFGPAGGQVDVFTSFDLEHDADLMGRLVKESETRGSGFKISARSERTSSAADDAMRRRIRESDEVVVICGEHTSASEQVSAEIRVAQEENKPYFLLWGRREVMCTKPSGARPDDSMYSWTSSSLRELLATVRRKAQPIEVPDRLKRP